MEPVVASLTATVIAKATGVAAQSIHESATELSTDDAPATVSGVFHDAFQDRFEADARSINDVPFLATAQASRSSITSTPTTLRRIKEKASRFSAGRMSI